MPLQIEFRIYTAVLHIFEPYQRRWRRVDNWIRDLFISGVSTRVVSWVMETFSRRPLTDNYLYIFFDGIKTKVRSCRRVVKKIVLVAYWIKSDGIRGLIDFRPAKSES